MRSVLTLKRLSLLCAGPLLLACSNLSDHVALPAAGTVARSADDAYQAGRNFHLARKYDDALRAYQQALAADPHHVNARNGIATLYAERRAFNQAIPIWRELTAPLTMSSGPSQAYLFSNLGYAYFLNGQYADAVTALEKACLLDPLSHSAWFHLGESLQTLGQEQRAQDMFRQAAALQAHDVRADLSAAGGSGVPALQQAVKAEARPGDEWAATPAVPHADSESGPSRPAAPPPPPEPLPVAVLTPPAPPPSSPRLPQDAVQPALLEIRNGNGVTGMARSLAQRMGDPSLKVVRLTNEKGFGVRQTRVEYQHGHLPAAQHLAARFENAALVEVSNCTRTDLRLVLGRDIARPDFALRPLPSGELSRMLAASGGVPGVN